MTNTNESSESSYHWQYEPSQMSVYRKVDHFLDRVKIRIIKVSEEPQDSGPENLFVLVDIWGNCLDILHKNKLEPLFPKSHSKVRGTSRSRRIKDAK